MGGIVGSVTSVPCSCDTIKRLARDERYPVICDEVTGEYQLQSVDGRWRHQMYYCPWCGGCLPSKRHMLFTEPDATEKAEVAELLSGARSIADVFHALGAPQRSTNCAAMGIPDEYASNAGWGKRQRSLHQYTARWSTLDLHIIEFDDGSVSYAVSGKFQGPSEPSKISSSWWPPWQRR